MLSERLWNTIVRALGGKHHNQRNAGGYVPARARKQVDDGLRDVFNAPAREQALARAECLMEGWRHRFPKLVAWLKYTLEEAFRLFHLPQAHRARVVRIFLNRESSSSRCDPADLPLASVLAMSQYEE